VLLLFLVPLLLPSAAAAAQYIVTDFKMCTTYDSNQRALPLAALSLLCQQRLHQRLPLLLLLFFPFAAAVV
jgi:hypothetical protein